MTCGRRGGPREWRPADALLVSRAGGGAAPRAGTPGVAPRRQRPPLPLQQHLLPPHRAPDRPPYARDLSGDDRPHPARQPARPPGPLPGADRLVADRHRGPLAPRGWPRRRALPRMGPDRPPRAQMAPDLRGLLRVLEPARCLALSATVRLCSPHPRGAAGVAPGGLLRGGPGVGRSTATEPLHGSLPGEHLQPGEPRGGAERRRRVVPAPADPYHAGTWFHRRHPAG